MNGYERIAEPLFDAGPNEPPGQMTHSGTTSLNGIKQIFILVINSA